MWITFFFKWWQQKKTSAQRKRKGRAHCHVISSCPHARGHLGWGSWGGGSSNLHGASTKATTMTRSWLYSFSQAYSLGGLKWQEPCAGSFGSFIVDTGPVSDVNTKTLTEFQSVTPLGESPLPTAEQRAANWLVFVTILYSLFASHLAERENQWTNLGRQMKMVSPQDELAPW